MNRVKNADIGDVSFSSYLTASGENFVQKLASSDQFLSPAVPSSQETPRLISFERTKLEEAELSVFGAENYYKMQLECDGSKVINTTSINQGFNKGSQIDLHATKPKAWPGTPSVSSESSWSSQTALLRKLPRNPSHSKLRKANGNGYFAGFSCSRSCLDKKSIYYIDNNAQRRGAISKEAVRVDQSSIMLNMRKQHQPRYQPRDEFRCPSFEKVSIRSNREEYFAFPSANLAMQNLTVKKQLKDKIINEEEARKSLEVFGSHLVKKRDISVDLERKLSMLSWDAIPKAQNLPPSSINSQLYEDVESDASSDLFEIENLAGNDQPVFTRQTSDDMSSCMSPTTPYEPSETSIEWSVVTASAADFSVASYDEKSGSENIRSPQVVRTRLTSDKEARRSRPSGLLGCKSHKAVSVAEGSVVSTPVRKLQSGNKVKDFDFP